MNFRPKLFLLGVLVGAAPTCAKPNFAIQQPARYMSRVWRAQDGLPESRVRALAQTPDGYLWAGTSSGLARFDGVRFVVYARFNTPLLMDDDIRALTVARDGSLWVGTDGGGLVHYKDGKFRSYGAKDGLANDFIGTVLEDSTGDVWAGTNRGLFRLHGERFRRIDEELHLPNIAFFGLCERRDGKVFAVGPSGLFVVESGKLVPYGKPRQEEIYHLAAAPDGSLWLGTNHGLRIVRGEQNSTNPPLASTPSAMASDRAGNIWLGTEGDGLFVERAGEAKVFRAPASLPDKNISAILEDREGNVWVATADGLVQLSVPQVDLLNSRMGLADENVSTIYSDHRGTIWLTTITGRIYKYSDGHLKAFRLPAPATDLRFRGTFEDHEGAFWFGTTSAGVVRLRNGKVSRFTMKEGLRNNGFQAFFEDRNNNLWIGTTSGISCWDGVRFTNYYVEHGLSYGWVRTISEDRNGDLLIGTDRGMNRVHNHKFVYDQAFAQLSHDRIWSIFRDAEDTIWIATPGAGLVRVRQGKVARITSREGLPGNSIFEVIGDARGRLWMSGPLGLSSASLTDLNSAADGRSRFVPVLSYGISEGLESTQMNGGVQPSGYAAPDGELWFAGIKGAAHLTPRLSPMPTLSPVRVESVRIDGRNNPASDEVVAGPGRRRVEIEFTACSLRNPERVNFRYRLDGFDTDWIPSTGHRTAIYDGLPPGHYHFRVEARDGARADAPTEAGIFLLVRPRFYQTSWFYALGFVIAGLSVAAVFRFRDKQAFDRYNLRLEERTRIAREMHDTVVQGCIGVSTLIEAAVSSAHSDRDQLLECLDNARIHLRLTVDEARQALLDLRHDSFRDGLCSALLELAQATRNETGTQVTVNASGPPGALPESVNRALLLVVREAIRNAVAHGGAGAVSINFCFEAGTVHLAIEDDGCGFEPSSPEILTGAGHFGILGMQERVEQIGGVLELVSCPGKGTIITARLPVV